MKKLTKAILNKKLLRSEKRLFKLEFNKARLSVFQRDEGKCVFCGNVVHPKHYQIAHIIPREFKETHNDINNLLLCCFYHHKVGKFSMHNHPIWFSLWLEKNRPTQYNYIKEKIKE